MENQKTFKAFAILGKKGGVILKKRFKIKGNLISFNGGEYISIFTFGNRWALFEKFYKEITKEQAKEFIIEGMSE
jgi:hypothetical protein